MEIDVRLIKRQLSSGGEKARAGLGVRPGNTLCPKGTIAGIIVSPIDIFASDASENRICVAKVSSWSELNTLQTELSGNPMTFIVFVSLQPSGMVFVTSTSRYQTRFELIVNLSICITTYDWRTNHRPQNIMPDQLLL